MGSGSAVSGPPASLALIVPAGSISRIAASLTSSRLALAREIVKAESCSPGPTP